ncbi:MAG: hypothetical protein KF878_05340 [Planctomycetes bacterium]|nr:hypothetical protein [Planctomycetota bacterium]
MRARSLVLVVVLVSGCSSGARPLHELLPEEVHVRQVAASLPGEYRPGVGGDGLPPYHLTWLPAGTREAEPPFVGYRLDGGASIAAIAPPGLLSDPGETFEVGAELVAGGGLPALRRVSMALHALAPLHQPDPPDPARAIEAQLALDGLLPARLRAALGRPPVAVQDTAPGEDGRTYRVTWTIDGREAPWGVTWLGLAADHLISVVVVDAQGGVARGLIVAKAMARAAGAEPR